MLMAKAFSVDVVERTAQHPFDFLLHTPKSSQLSNQPFLVPPRLKCLGFDFAPALEPNTIDWILGVFPTCNCADARNIHAPAPRFYAAVEQYLEHRAANANEAEIETLIDAEPNAQAPPVVCSFFESAASFGDAYQDHKYLAFVLRNSLKRIGRIKHPWYGQSGSE
jgi:hypothetical protein